MAFSVLRGEMDEATDQKAIKIGIVVKIAKKMVV